MLTKKYNSASFESKSVIAISALQLQTTDRLKNAQARLNPKSVFAANANKNKNADSFFGTLLLNMMVWNLMIGGLEHFFGHGVSDALGGADLSHGGFVSAAAEAAEMLADERTDKEMRKIDGYPEGRRSAGRQKSPTAKKFNLVAANENAFDLPTEGEMTKLTEVLDMLDLLARKGVTSLALDDTQTVHASLKAGKRNAGRSMFFHNKGLHLHSAA